MVKNKIFHIIFIFMIILLFCGCNSKEKEADLYPNFDFENWMEEIPDSTLMTNLVIPGSHDAGTVEMNFMANTQDLTIKEQLEIGTRYFDIRVRKTKKDELVIYHSIINGVEFLPILDDIKDFISNHPSEVLLLDFQHFDGNSQEEVYQNIIDNLGDYLVENNTEKTDMEFINSLTIGDVRGKCIIFWGSSNTYDDNRLFVRATDLGERENNVLYSFYDTSYNTLPSKKYIDTYIQKYIDMFKEKEGGFFVLQGQLTDKVYVRGPKKIENSHKTNMSNYINSLQTKADFSYINIIMRDFVDKNKNAEIINLNYHKGFLLNPLIS